MVRYWCLRNSSVCIYENIPFHWITSALYRMRCSNVPWQMSGKFSPVQCEFSLTIVELICSLVSANCVLWQLMCGLLKYWSGAVENAEKETKKKRIEEKITIDEHLFASSCCLTAVTIQTIKCPHWYSRVEKHTRQTRCQGPCDKTINLKQCLLFQSLQWTKCNLFFYFCSYVFVWCCRLCRNCCCCRHRNFWWCFGLILIDFNI